jgi:hypothetical protein
MKTKHGLTLMPIQVIQAMYMLREIEPNPLKESA